MPVRGPGAVVSGAEHRVGRALPPMDTAATAAEQADPAFLTTGAQ